MLPAASPRTHLRHIALYLLISLAACLLLVACDRNPLVRQESYVFGTRVEVLSAGVAEQQAQDALAAVLREFDRIHQTYHAWQPSQLTAVTAACQSGKPLQVTAEMAGLIRASQDFAQRSKQLFEPAIGKLIELWGFHADTFTPRLPADSEIKALLAAHPQVAQISFAGNTLQCHNPAIALDLGGIAKGWALDQAAAILHAHGVHNALINIGGNVMALGKKGDQPWQVGIQDPRGSGAIASLSLYDGEAVGTSGDYQRFFELGGQRYSHLIDPRSGRPAEGTEAVTVLVTPRAHAGMLSDVTSKPVFLGGADGWRAMAQRMDIQHVLRVDGTGRIQVTQAMQARLRWSEGRHADEVVN
ncbi:FAD:protein FMN transferase [Uliginosibacterium sediminicola]|uniref:FAD:protein FMN transferase n=1 Tax=Uliginosibacterium sediminicola TaxID=2024550 RepID=A0ABU9YY72_9RHOO